MSNYNLSVDLAPLLGALNGTLSTFMPMVSQAVGAIAQQAQYQWMDGVKQARLWSVEKQAYINSITWEMQGDYTAVVKSDYDKAEEIENGRPARDLKKMLATSPKVRTTKDGRKFLVIPFRHNTPGNTALANAMPPSVYDLASKMTMSSVTGQSQRPAGEVTEFNPAVGMFPSPNQSGNAWKASGKPMMMVPRHHYKWGDRLPAGLMPKMKPEHKTDIYAGMVRMNTSTGEGKSSAYMTFRVMVENSSGWVIPPQPGLHLVEKTAQEIQPLAEAALSEAVKRTFMA